MVSANAQAVAGEFVDLADERDFYGYGVLAGALAGGAFVAQRLTREVLPFFGISPTSTSTSGLVAQALTKVAIAFALAWAAMQVDSSGQSTIYSLLGIAAGGAVTMAGASVFRLGENIVFNNPSLNGGGTSAAGNVGRVVESASPSTSISSASAPARADGGYFD